jgi:membrane protease YdiL (CAAX protease family)
MILRKEEGIITEFKENREMKEFNENQDYTEQDVTSDDTGWDEEVRTMAELDDYLGDYQEQPDQDSIIDGEGDFQRNYRNHPPLRRPPTTRLLWRAVTPLLTFLLIPTIVGGIILGVYGMNQVMLDNSLIYDIDSLYENLMLWFLANVLLITMLGQICCLAPFIPIWMKIRKKITPYQRVLNPFKLSVNFFFAFAGFSLVLSMMLTIIDIQKLLSYEIIEEILFSGSVAVRIITIVIVAPIVEELCFRGIILNRLLSWTTNWTAIVIQAALFGLAHMNPVQTLYGFIIGLAFGYLYVRYRNLWLCILGHFAFNLPSVLISVLQEYSIILPVMALMLPALVFTIVCGRYLLNHPPALPVVEEYEPEAEPQPAV